ncbi:MAG: LamG domain-containing protein, partial [Saprospiraceae bacterium]|nr:LamG domain-containing protein [Saprospiraceae bacterium]
MTRLFLFAFCLFASAGLIAQNYSLDFDGSDDHVVIGAMPVLNNASYLTLECWVKFDATPAATGAITIIHNYYTPGSYSRWMIVKSILDDELHLAVSNNSNISNIFTTDANLVAGIWYHFALVFNGTQLGEENKLRFYINGLQKTLYFGAQSNGPLPNTLPGSGGTVYLGKTPSNVAALDGKLDDMRVWSTARTQAEIQSYMNTELSGSESGLVAYYKFDENNLNCDVGDCSNNDYHGARQGAGGSNNLPQYSDIIPTLTNVPCGTPINSTYYRD